MHLREEFVLNALAPDANFAELCRERDISRKTGYKWARRFRERGVVGLSDLSRRPHGSPLRADGEMVLEVVRLRLERPRWGPKKLRAVLLRSHSVERVPSVRTIARIIDRAGLVEPRRRAEPTPGEVAVAPSVVVKVPHDLWTVDFKGWWRSRDGARCEPLTVRDAHSRFVLCAQLTGTTAGGPVRQVFERLFEQHGLPLALQVDNGSPFASTRARGGLTALSAWWVSLGIRVVRGRPAHPQDNGAHERMHADMSSEVEHPGAPNVERQQHLLDAWVQDFNHVRPHEALGQRVPADLYARSPRIMRGPLPARYAPGTAARRVSCVGCIKFDGRIVRVGNGLRGLLVGVQPVTSERIRVRFYDLDLGEFTLSPKRAA